MNNKLLTDSSPHITKKGNTTRRIMIDVLIALFPAFIAAVIFFGYHVIINVVFCVGFCTGFELLFNLFVSKKWNREGVRQSSHRDFSSAVTGVILALNLPPIIKIWGLNIISGGDIIFSFDTVIACLLASAAAIILVKMLFGGIGRNFANPAAVGRIFLALAFTLPALAPVWRIDGITHPTLLFSPTANPSLLRLFLGKTGSAAVGETSVLAILIGYVYLSVRRVIDFRIPLALVLTAAVFILLFDGIIVSGLSGKELFYETLRRVFSGGLIFGAVFMATDYATSPNTFLGQIIFAMGIAFIAALIRAFAANPEGMSYAIVIMNIFSLQIDKYIRKKPFGYTKTKEAKREKA